MAGLFDIGSSGIEAYRKALSVTGQNIANLNTEGYRRREASMEEISATQGDILSISDQAGLGVRVSDITRAFDSFIATRARDTASDFSRADAYKGALDTLETVMLPEDYDLGKSINDFFDGMSAIAQAPGDLSGRVVALEQGRSLAAAFTSLSRSLGSFQAAVVSEVENSVSALNTELAGLADIQAQLISAGGSGKASNALMDQRDKSISALAEYAGVSAEYSVRGDVRLTLGATGTGPVLVEGKEASMLSVTVADGQINVYAGGGAGATQTQQLTSGGLAGLISAYETISQTTRDLDALARKVASDLNTVHAEGMTLDGAPGSDLFSLSSYTLNPDANNLGSVTAYATPTDAVTDADFTLEVTYNKAAGEWRGLTATGTVLARGSDGFTYEGVEVALNGQPADGDTFTLVVSQGKAANMSFALSRAEEFAAAGPLIASASLDNQSTASLAALGFVEPPASGLPDFTASLPNDAGVAAATRFRADGVVGVIPASVEAIELFSLRTQDNVTFSLSDAQQGEFTTVTLTVDGTAHSFSTTAFTQKLDTLPDVDLSDLADMLNAGTILTTNGVSLDSLGVYAAGEGGLLSFASGTTTLSAARLEAGGTITGAVSSASPQGSDIQIFTREGRQISGTPLSDAEVMSYLTPTNGFSETAEYRADYLNGVAEGGLQGIDVARQSTEGAHVLRLSGAGFTPSVDTADTAAEIVGTPAQTVSIAVGTDSATEITIPQGVMADYIASEINALRGDLGVTAVAQTRVALTDVPDGVVQFSLIGENDEAVSFSSNVQGGDLTDLAALINAKSSETSIAAHVSSDLQKLVLVNSAGSDIVMQDVVTTGAALQAVPVGIAGHARLSATTALGTGAQSLARFGGEVTLKADKSFTVSATGGTKSSAANSFEQGLVAREIDGAGSWQDLAFQATEGIDGNEGRPDGSLASAAAASFSLSLETDGSADRMSATVETGALDDLSSGTIAAALAKDIRSTAPVPVLKGSAFASVGDLPSDGSSITLTLGAQDYVLTMQEGEVVVSGPEAGRLSAGFDDNNQLVVSAQDGMESGQMLGVAASASATSMQAFGLSVTGRTAVMSGRVIDSTAMTTTPLDLTLEIDGTEYTVSISDDGAGNAVTAASPSLPSNTSVGLTTVTNGVQVQITRTGTDTDTDFRVIASDDARSLGFDTTPNQLLVTDAGLRASTQDGTAVDVTASASSLIHERVSLSNLPPEELIVILTGDGARRLSARYDVAPTSDADPVQRPIEVRVADADSGRVEIIDSTSGHSIASRYLDTSGRMNVAGMDLLLNGAVATGDSFTIAANTNSAGDGRNIEKLLALQSLNTQSGRGGFTSQFSALITDMGAKVKASNIAAQSAEAVKDAAAELEAEFSGVNLDTEAARLLEQQQAYQALARVLSTAKELLDTLMNSI